VRPRIKWLRNWLSRIFGTPRLHIDIDLWLLRFYLWIVGDHVNALEFVWIHLQIGTGQTPLFGISITRQANDLERNPRVGWPNYLALRLPGWHREFHRKRRSRT